MRKEKYERHVYSRAAKTTIFLLSLRLMVYMIVKLFGHALRYKRVSVTNRQTANAVGARQRLPTSTENTYRMLNSYALNLQKLSEGGHRLSVYHNGKKFSNSAKCSAISGLQF